MKVWARMCVRVLRSLGLINSAEEDPSCPKGIRKVARTHPKLYRATWELPGVPLAALRVSDPTKEQAQMSLLLGRPWVTL